MFVSAPGVCSSGCVVQFNCVRCVSCHMSNSSTVSQFTENSQLGHAVPLLARYHRLEDPHATASTRLLPSDGKAIGLLALTAGDSSGPAAGGTGKSLADMDPHKAHAQRSHFFDIIGRKSVQQWIDALGEQSQGKLVVEADFASSLLSRADALVGPFVLEGPGLAFHLIYVPEIAAWPPEQLPTSIWLVLRPKPQERAKVTRRRVARIEESAHMCHAANALTDIKPGELKFPGATRNLVWGVKESFRTYFERLSDHAYSFEAGTSRSSEGTFSFPARAQPESLPDGGWLLAFTGTLAMTAHHGALSVTLAGLEILLDREGRGTLSAIVDEENEQAIRMVIADLRFDGMAGGLETPQANFSASLATDGQYLFMGNYFAGDPLDPVAIQLEGPPAS